MREPNEQGPALFPAAASRDADPTAAAPAKPTSRWGFLRCLATWMPGGSGGMTATGTHIWTHLRNDHD
jgi:hypothetical protein